jgi:AraC-like DNA-binding protein
MTERLTGALYTYQTHVLYVGPLIASARHTHHAGQVMWAPEGLLVDDESGGERRVMVHVVPPHRTHSHGAAMAAAVLWVDRDDLQWDRALQSNLTPRRLPPTIGTRQQAPSRQEARELAHALLELVAPAGALPARVAQHVAVRRMCTMLDSTAADREISLTQLAKQSGLSVRQLRHRFTEELGINPSAYLRWRRLRRAVACIEQGATLTQAAVQAGFADGAHFSRVFQAQFGMAPSQALSSVHFAGPLA